MPELIYVSILLPAFQVKHENQIDRLIKTTLCLSSQQYEVFEIPSKIGREFGVKLFENSFSLQELERVIEENKILQHSYEKCRESLQALNAEFEKIINDPQVLNESDKMKYQKSLNKHKQVKEENKRLRQLLKQPQSQGFRSQLDNSEKQRMETQLTVESLREELDLLVKELASLQQQKKQNDILISN